ncbi:hypothetical protein PYCCODRAFT_651070 [Trametes coccinea BRFM310]|uniref:Uncharacterized protein n=1 Tax=Trametes coccinea (strain BRFM310) TaxID=1353009 RepID=A0A1Y2IIH6_TRAC3|nr:hypothetical protein PYCCODRAFT_651070 [Trametes coccinea BRFM310]
MPRAGGGGATCASSASGIPDPHCLADKRPPRSTLSNCDRDYDCDWYCEARSPASACLFGVIICFTSRQRQPRRPSSSSSARPRRRPARSATDSQATRTRARPPRIENVARDRPRIRPPAPAAN